MEWNEIIAEIIMAPINFIHWLLMLIADNWGAGVALGIAVVTLLILKAARK